MQWRALIVETTEELCKSLNDHFFSLVFRVPVTTVQGPLWAYYGPLQIPGPTRETNRCSANSNESMAIGVIHLRAVPGCGVTVVEAFFLDWVGD